MTVLSKSAAVSHTGNGVADTFAFTFKVFKEADLYINLYEIATKTLTLLAITTDYTVSLVDKGAGGGSVTLLAGPLPATHKIIIQRLLSYTQETDWVENDPFPAQSTEDAIDKNLMLIQQLKEELDRALLGSITTEAGVIAIGYDSGLPKINAGDANKIIQVKADESGYELKTVAAVITSVIESAININSFTEKNPPVSGDILMIEDSADSYSKKKVQIGNLATAIGVSPTGSIILWSTATAPTGYLICDGKTLGDATSGADYAGNEYRSLYDVIKATYGGTHNWTNHNTVTLPNLKGRTVIGVGQGSTYANGVDAAGTNFALAASSGMEKHKLVTAEMPEHSHNVPRGSSSTGTQNAACLANAIVATDLATSNAGSDTAHNNMQPYLALNYVIKY